MTEFFNEGFEFPLINREAVVHSDNDFLVLPTPQVQMDVWKAMNLEARWPHFHPLELRCKGSGGLIVHYQTMDCLQRLRWAYKGPIGLTSAYRCVRYNEHVGGSENSFHTKGRAFDTPLLNGNAPGLVKLVHLATKAGFTGFGVYEKFTHIDTGPMRFW